VCCFSGTGTDIIPSPRNSGHAHLEAPPAHWPWEPWICRPGVLPALVTRGSARMPEKNLAAPFRFNKLKKKTPGPCSEEFMGRQLFSFPFPRQNIGPLEKNWGGFGPKKPSPPRC